MIFELKATLTTIDKTLKVLVSGDTIQIDQTNVTINIKDNPFEFFNQPDSYYRNNQDQLKLIEEEKTQIEDEKKEQERKEKKEKEE